MKLRNKVIKNAHIAYALLVIGVIGLAALFYDIAMDNVAIRITGIVFIAITALYAIPIFIFHFPTKSFDRYYKKLSKAERERFELELESRYRGLEYTVTSREIVIVDFISIRVIEIMDIISIKRMQADKMLFLNMKSGRLEVIRETVGYSVEQIMEDILEQNPNIVQER